MKDGNVKSGRALIVRNSIQNCYSFEAKNISQKCFISDITRWIYTDFVLNKSLEENTVLRDMTKPKDENQTS